MEFTVKQIANLIGGRIEGNENAKIHTLSKIEGSKEGTLTFLSNLKYAHLLNECEASAIIVYNDFNCKRPDSITFIRVEDPRTAIAKLLSFYVSLNKPKPHISEKASIAHTAKIGKDVYIADFVFIGDNVEIGDNCEIHSFVNIANNCKIGSGNVIYSFASIYYDVCIGNNCILHSGCVIGADGFGFVPQADGTYYKVPQVGNVIIGNDVEIGSNTCIDRATMGSTIVRDRVKMDNLVQIAHNTDIGENSIFAGMSAVAGSSKVGRNALLGGAAGILDNCTIADYTSLSSSAMVFSSIKEPNKVWKGTPAIELNNFNRSYVHFKNLDTLVKRVADLEKMVKELTNK